MDGLVGRVGVISAFFIPCLLGNIMSTGVTTWGELKAFFFGLGLGLSGV